MCSRLHDRHFTNRPVTADNLRATTESTHARCPARTPAARRGSARPERLADEVVKRSAAQPRGGSRVSACRPMTGRFLRGLRTNRRHDSEVMG
jgi:hypothetical protein